MTGSIFDWVKVVEEGNWKTLGEKLRKQTVEFE